MAGFLKTPQHHQRQQATDVQTVGGGVKACVDGTRLLVQPLGEDIVGGRLVNQPPPLELGKNVGHEKAAVGLSFRNNITR